MRAAVDEFGSPTNMTTVSAPGFDLLKVDRYASGALQYSRGCPFQCEFCDRLTLLWSLFWALLWDGSLFSVGSIYLRYFFGRNLKHRPGIIGFAQFMNRCVTHWHFYKFTRELTAGRLRAYNTL